MATVCTPGKFSKTMDGGPLTIALASDTGNTYNVLSNESVERLCTFLGPTFHIYTPDIPEEGLVLSGASGTTITIVDPNFKMITHDNWNGKALYFHFNKSASSTSSNPFFYGLYDSNTGNSISSSLSIGNTYMSDTNNTVMGINNGKVILLSFSIGAQIALPINGDMPILFKVRNAATTHICDPIDNYISNTNTFAITIRHSRTFIYIPAFYPDRDYDYASIGVYYVLSIINNVTDGIIIYDGHVYNTCSDATSSQGSNIYLDITGLED